MIQTFWEKLWYGNDEHTFLEASTYRIVSTGVVGAGMFSVYRLYQQNKAKQMGLSLPFFSFQTTGTKDTRRLSSGPLSLANQGTIVA